MTAAVSDELFLLPCDHRSILRDLYLGANPGDESGAARWISDAKEVVLDGLLQAIEVGIPASSTGLLIDEEYGARVAKRAQAQGVAVFMPVDHGELGPFELQYGDRFVEHIERQRPDYVTALVEYAPADPGKSDQLRRLDPLLSWLASSGYPFLLELQVPPTASQLLGFDGDREAWIEASRPGEIRKAIEELKRAGARPAVWKIEACATAEQYADLARLIRANGQDDTTMVVLGAGAGIDEVGAWLSVAAREPACIGFAVGRTVWLEGLTSWANRSLGRAAAVEAIARTYGGFCSVFRSARG
jgi:myo-inositol catabolism protein IolC